MDKRLLYTMLRIRMVEEAIAREYPKQEMRCPTHLSIGQEAVAAGVCAALGADDVVFSTHRCHAHYLARGGSLPAMIAELYGKATGCAGGIGGSQHLVDRTVNFWGAAPIVASTIPVAVGVALARRMQGQPGITVSFFGDAATEEGVFYESLNYAALRALPVLFVCEHNGYSTNTPTSERQPERSLVSLARAMGVNWAKEGDGNDVSVVYDVAAQAIASVRRGKGPAVAVFFTYRTLEHCGPFPDPPGYRPEAEKASWVAKDPIVRYEAKLLREGTLHREDLERMKTRVGRAIVSAFAFAKQSPYPRRLRKEMVYAR